MTVLAHLAVWLPTAIVVAALMDAWAALLHGRVWHRALWPIHVSHHTRRRGRFEANDALSALHAPVAIALILYGCRANEGVARELAFGVGVGMSAFGLSYLIVHDGLVHGRLPVRALLRVGYLREVVRAHRVHHATRDGGPPYGLFFGPFELRRHRARAPLTPSPRRASPPREAPTSCSLSGRDHARPCPKPRDGATPSGEGTR